MSDFFSNLIARSSAVAPAIQPRLPSLFEATPAETFGESETTAGPATTTETAAPVHQAPAMRSPNKSALSNPAPSDANLSSDPPSQEIKIATFNDEVAERIEPRTPADPAQPVRPAPPKVVKRLLSPATRPLPRSSIADDFSAMERPQNPRRSSPPTESNSANAAPTIHVTIGRVEVRAIQPAVAAPRSAKPAPPKLSLDDYLQKREGAAR